MLKKTLNWTSNHNYFISDHRMITPKQSYIGAEHRVRVCRAVVLQARMSGQAGGMFTS